MDAYVGIDFGTTNSAIAVATRDGVELVSLPGPGGAPAPTWRTVLFFDPAERTVVAGAAAIEAYLDTEGDGRLIQSIKSYLASAAFSKTSIFGRTWSIEELIAAYLVALRKAGGVDLGRRAVVGRPVRYWGAETADDDARAVGRMRRALEAAGFDEVVFELEPLGAAARYAARLDHDELVLVADFGGGTSDFSLVRVGAHTDGEVLGTGGLGLGGDSFDARLIDAIVAPQVGRGTRFRDEMGAETPVPAWLFHRLRRWHHLSFLKAAETLRLLERIEHGSLAPALIERLGRLIRDDLGLSLHEAVVATKVALSGADAATFGLEELDLVGAPRRAEFEAWIAPDLDDIDVVLDRVLADAGVDAADVDRVFATGGSALVPAVRRRLAARFGDARLSGGEELTSVCWGLAARARTLFG
ncbi:MAG: Hsp70 family protein [Kofleriaceae bacterium]|nr:Hsp70 family protein [Myxococcales bacterium]MCB9563978.1 Hsp70 family protein [Kofleriaceae bacterium]